MTVSIPLVLILGAAVFVAWRFMGLRMWHAIVCLLFGVFLATTAAGPQIRQVVAVIVKSFTAS